MFKAVSSSTVARVPALRVSDVGTQCDFETDLAGCVPTVPDELHTDLLEAINVISDFHVEMVTVGTGLAIQQNYYERMRVATARLRLRLGSISALNTIPELAAISSSPQVDPIEEPPATVSRTFIARSPRESLAISRSRQHNEPIVLRIAEVTANYLQYACWLKHYCDMRLHTYIHLSTCTVQLCLCY